MQKLAAVSLILVLMLVSVSAYLRLDHSGIGCSDWPACYGQIGEPASVTPTIESTYERLGREAQQPMSWATPVHRLVASLLGLCVLGMALISLRSGRDRAISLLLLALTVFLAWLGIHSGGLHNPAVVMGNLVGGFTMLGLLGRFVFRNVQPKRRIDTSVRRWVVAGLLLLFGQIALGGLTSANFAASACQTLPDCHGSYLPGANLGKAFDLSREHEIGPTGMAMGGPERADIHKLHRIGAVVTAFACVIAGFLALRAGAGGNAGFVIAIVLAEFGVGVAAVLTEIPIEVAVAHNWMAAILLLALLRLLALCTNRQALL